MARDLNMERVRYFAGRVHEDVGRLRAMVAGRRGELNGAEEVRLRMLGADLRDHARLVAEFTHAREPDLLPEVQVRLVLDWAADYLGREGERCAAELLRDRDTRLEAMRRFCGEEPAGL